MIRATSKPLPKIHFVGIDFWECAVFRTENGTWLKSETLVPEYPTLRKSWTTEVKQQILDSLHTTDGFDGEPFSPVSCKQLDTSECWEPMEDILFRVVKKQPCKRSLRVSQA